MFTAIWTVLKKYPSAFLAVVAVFIIVSLLFINNTYKNKLATVSNQLHVQTANLNAFNDSNHVLLTKNGEIVFKLAFLQSTIDGLQGSVFYKDKQIYTQQTTIASLQLQLNQNTVNVIATDSSIGATFHNTYKDTGLTVISSDSVSFAKAKDSSWTGTNHPTFQASLVLRNTVGRNATGDFYGSVETFSPRVKIDSTITIVSDEYIPLTSVKIPTYFGIGGSVDAYSAAIGIFSKPSGVLYGLEYQLFMKNAPDNLSWFSHIRATAVYFIW